MASETMAPPLTVRASPSHTVHELKCLIATAMNQRDSASIRMDASESVVAPSVDGMCCVLERYGSELLPLCDTNMLQQECFSKTNKIYVECSGDEADVDFLNTSFYRLLDRFQNTIRLHVSLPSTNAVLEAERIYAIKKDDHPIPPPPPHPACSLDHDDIASPHDDSAPWPSSDRFELDDADGQPVSETGTSEAGASSSGGSSNTLVDCGQLDSWLDAAAAPADTVGWPDVSADEDALAEWGADSQTNAATEDAKEGCRRYFSATMPSVDPDETRSLTVHTDKRITISSLMNELVPYVGISADNFKVYRVYDHQEFECSRMMDTLCNSAKHSKLAVKLERALKKGEYRVRIYQLQVNEVPPMKLLVESIFSKGMTVLESKRVILSDLSLQGLDEIPLNRLRLRKRTCRNPTSIYYDHLVYDEDIAMLTNWEIIAEVINEDERVTDFSKRSVYVKRWWPATYELGPMDEVVLNGHTVDELRQKICDLSCIPLENVSFAKGIGSFPFDVSVLVIDQELNWDVDMSVITASPLSIHDDGAVIYYRDKTEKLGELSEERRRALQHRHLLTVSYEPSIKVNFSPRKERALKIYTDDAKKPIHSIGQFNSIQCDLLT